MGEGITGLVAATGETYVTEDLARDVQIHILPEEADYVHNAHSHLSLALQTQESVIGVMHVARGERRPFAADEVRLAQAISDITANALHRAMMTEGLEGEIAVRTAQIWSEKEKSEAILRSVGDGILMVDRELKVRYANPAYTAMTGYTIDDLYGQHVGHRGVVVSEQDEQAIQAALSRDESWQGEGTVQRKDGRTYEAALIISPVHDAEGRVTAYVSSHRDISQQRQLERARSQFITNVSHELRTPLSTLKLYAWLLREKRKPERIDEFFQRIVHQADRMTRLVEDFLEMAELDSGRAEMQRQPLQIQALVHDAVERYRTQASEADLVLRVEPSPADLPVVQGDRARLTQALGELLENAVIFTPAGGQVTVEARMAVVEDQPWVMVDVRDTGPGVTLEEQDRVFDRLYRGRLAESGHIPGTGLGLSIARAIVQAHGGRVTVDSQPPEGSTFTVWLPVAPSV
jgi:PAS domain S-box-containing protein